MICIECAEEKNLIRKEHVICSYCAKGFSKENSVSQELEQFEGVIHTFEEWDGQKHKCDVCGFQRYSSRPEEAYVDKNAAQPIDENINESNTINTN